MQYPWKRGNIYNDDKYYYAFKYVIQRFNQYLISPSTSNFRSIFRDYHLNKDPTCLHSVARGMMTLQAVFGFIPRIYGKGRSAKQLCEYMMNMRREMQAAELELSVPPQFDQLIILDRQVSFSKYRCLLTHLQLQILFVATSA